MVETKLIIKFFPQLRKNYYIEKTFQNYSVFNVEVVIKKLNNFFYTVSKSLNLINLNSTLLRKIIIKFLLNLHIYYIILFFKYPVDQVTLKLPLP